MESSFSYTLVSNQNTDYFAKNNHTFFSNIFPKSVNLKNYDVALEAFSYHDRYSKVADDITVFPNDGDLTKPFFNKERGDHEITIQQSQISSMGVRKWEDKFSNFVTILSDYLKQQGFDVHLSCEFEQRAGKPYVKAVFVTSNILPPWQLLISKPLNKILGFSNQVFQRGESKSDLTPDEDSFNKLSETGYFAEVTMFTVEKTSVELPDLYGLPYLSTVLTAIVAALDEKGYNLSLVYRKSKKIVEYEVELGRVNVMLSKFLNNYLGLDDNFVFSNSGSFRIPPGIVKPGLVISGLIELPPRSCSKLLILCNIISNQYFAGKELPILAVVDRTESESFKEISFRPSPMVYKPVAVDTVSHITISVQADNSDYLESTKEPTVVTLNFRKR